MATADRWFIPNIGKFILKFQNLSFPKHGRTADLETSCRHLNCGLIFASVIDVAKQTRSKRKLKNRRVLKLLFEGGRANSMKAKYAHKLVGA